MASEWILRGHSAPVVSLDCAESLLVSSSLDGSARLWDCRQPSASSVLDLRPFARASEEQDGEFADVGVVRFHPQTAKCVFAAVGRFLLKFDLRKTDRTPPQPQRFDALSLFHAKQQTLRRAAASGDGNASAEEDEASDFEINDFDLWVPSPEQRRRLLSAATGASAPVSTSRAKTANGSKLRSASSAEVCEASEAPVCVALPFDSGHVKVLVEKARKTNSGTDGGEMRVESISLANKHLNICGVARFRQTRVLDLISGGFDCQVRTHDVLSGRGRCCFDAQRLTGSPLQLRSKTKNGGGSAVAGQRQIWNPPFVTSLAVHAEDSVVAAGLGSGGVYFFRYAESERNARLSPLFEVSTHGAAVTQLRFLPRGDAEACEFLLSCGDDACLCLLAQSGQGFSSMASAGGQKPQLRLKKRLSCKPNALAAQTSTAAGTRVFVGDVSPDIKVFEGIDRGGGLSSGN